MPSLNEQGETGRSWFVGWQACRPHSQPRGHARLQGTQESGGKSNLNGQYCQCSFPKINCPKWVWLEIRPFRSWMILIVSAQPCKMPCSPFCIGRSRKFWWVLFDLAKCTVLHACYMHFAAQMKLSFFISLRSNVASLSLCLVHPKPLVLHWWLMSQYYLICTLLCLREHKPMVEWCMVQAVVWDI